MTICSAYDKDTIDFSPYKIEKSSLFLVKNIQSEAVALCDEFSSKAGYSNPIDYLGKDDFSLKCPAMELAEEFMQQDKEVISKQVAKIYLIITTYANNHIDFYITTKQPYQSLMVCNGWKLTHGLIHDYFYNVIYAINKQYHSLINHCYEFVDRYTGLTIRETEVMFFLMRSQNSTAISQLLGLSKRTVQHYIDNVKQKMSCHSTQQLTELGLYLKFNQKIPASLIPNEHIL
jgi:DNA-binding CsgD family transcriptional regulator